MATKGTPAIALLRHRRVPHTVHEYSTDPRSGGGGYGEQAAAALGVSPSRVFKTLVARVDGTLAVGVVPVAGGLDLKALAAALGGKRAAMADPADAERTTGYVRGGISPLGQRRRLPTVLDTSATGFDTVFVSAGRRGLQVELAPDALAELTGATVAPVSTAAPS